MMGVRRLSAERARVGGKDRCGIAEKKKRGAPIASGRREVADDERRDKKREDGRNDGRNSWNGDRNNDRNGGTMVARKLARKLGKAAG